MPITQKSFKKNNLVFRFNQNTVIAFRKSDGQCGMGLLIDKIDELLYIDEIKNFNFDNKLLGYNVTNSEYEKTTIDVNSMHPYLGHIYDHGEDKYAIFKNILNFDLLR